MNGLEEDILRFLSLHEGGGLREIATLAGVSYTTLTRFVKGERSLTIGTLDNLCRALGLELANRIEPVPKKKVRRKKKRKPSAKRRLVPATMQPAVPLDEFSTVQELVNLLDDMPEVEGPVIPVDLGALHPDPKTGRAKRKRTATKKPLSDDNKDSAN